VPWSLMGVGGWSEQQEECVGASTSGAGIDGVLVGGVDAAVAGAPWVPLTMSDDGPGARRRRVAVAGVSLMGAAALSTAVFQTVAGTSTSLAMTPGLGAMFAGSSTPAPQGPAMRPTGLATPAITDLGPVPGSAVPPSAASVFLQAQRGPLPGPGETGAVAGPVAGAPVVAGGGPAAPAAGAPARVGGAGVGGSGSGGSSAVGPGPAGSGGGGSGAAGPTTTRPTTTTPTSTTPAPPTTTTAPPSTSRPPVTTTPPRSTTHPSNPPASLPPRSSSSPSPRPSVPSPPKPSSGSSKGSSDSSAQGKASSRS
jgi:hypothetical protein